MRCQRQYLSPLLSRTKSHRCQIQATFPAWHLFPRIRRRPPVISLRCANQADPVHLGVTGNEEHIPFVVTLASLPRTDFLLLKTAQDILESAGRLTSVITGKVMFSFANETNDCK